ncbi:MAG TPA: NAD-dependent epimerase/dehydratase family protein [Candidatus Acidoferrales bacterium]|nr:NAD-dependent epimerase/dehydratase family protein [Candidatus Acidoferrales bacterium]
MTVVTGGTGFIGAHLIERLTSAGEPVRAIVRRETSLPRGAVAVRCDFANGKEIADALRDADVVIHLAGATKVLRRLDYYTSNVGVTENLVRAVAGRRVRFVHVSSLAAIGPTMGPEPLDEDAAPHPITEYGKSKLEAERVVRRLAPDAVVVRPPVVYGPRDTDVFQFLKSISRGFVLEIAGGERWFNAVYVKDLCDGLLAAARCPKAAGRTYFLAHPRAVSWTEFGATAAKILGREPRIIRVPAAVASAVGMSAEIWARFAGKASIVSREKIREAKCRAWTCQTGRATDELGFTAPTGIDEGLARTLAWYREAGWL